MTTHMVGANRIANPLRRGQRVTIPKNTPVRTTHPSKPDGYFTKRATTVTIAMVSDGWLDLWNDSKKGRGYVLLPTITWAGAGGYWCDVKVTPELCAALGVDVPELPAVDERLVRLDMVPAYGVTSDNRDC